MFQAMCGKQPGRAHRWTLLSILQTLFAGVVLAAAHVHGANRSTASYCGQHGYDDYEQCLCKIGPYALFYNKVFDSQACSDVGNKSIISAVRDGRRFPKPVGAGAVLLTCSSHPPTHARTMGSGHEPAACPSNGINHTNTSLTLPLFASQKLPGVCDEALSGAAARRDPASSSTIPSRHQQELPSTSAAAILSSNPIGLEDATATSAAKQLDITSDPNGRIIVRFDHYAPADNHRDSLQRVLGPEGPLSWCWLPRPNAAARFPTDFGLLAAAPGNEAHLRQRLSTAAGVRDVHLDRRYTGKLSWVPEGPLQDMVLNMQGASSRIVTAGSTASSSVLAEGTTAEVPDEVVFSVSSRRPGRMVTRFSEEALTGEEDPEAQREAGEQRVWRSPAAMAAARWHSTDPHATLASMGLGADLEESYGLASGQQPDVWVETQPAIHSGEQHRQHQQQDRTVEEEENEEKEGAAQVEGGGLMGSRRRVASVATPSAHDGHGAAGAGLPKGKHPHHQQLHQSVHRRKRHRDHFFPQHQEGGGDAAEGGVADTDILTPHTGRMAGHLGLGSSGGESTDDAGSSRGGRSGNRARWRRQLNLELRGSGVTVPVLLQADRLWRQGYTGQGVKVGIFDTGIRQGHPHIRKIRERTNWTHQDSLSDGLGHGSFVAGVVGGQDSQCPGFAPDVDLYTFKVFTDDQVSYTSWFLDAFNYAMIVQVNVINLSIGGPDYLDQPFVDKVLEVTSNGILMVSAIGNDGPLYGTLNNPADQNDVIGVGGIDNYDNIASFSSRGMSTWELPRGYGRVKPDVMAYSKDVQGSKMEGGCRALSGTSVASPVVTGAVCLLASTVPVEHRWELLNPASMKQALVEGAVRLNNLNIYEQGSGRINLPNSMAILHSYKPRASIIPASLDLTDCPYMWPFCREHLYAGALPIIFNATLLNGQGVVGWLEGEPSWRPTDSGGELLHITFEWSQQLWPWSGNLALYLRVRAAGAEYSGLANGVVELAVVSPPAPGEDVPRRSVVTLPVRARIGPTPPRSRRVLWDQFHSLKYPPAYLPRDNLEVKSDILDWHGDHPHTNFHGVYNMLRDRGYFLEILGSPATCFDPAQYGALLIVDSEEEWYPEEISALEAAVSKTGLNLLVFADWYNLASLDQMRFFDDNTRSWWDPATGGANVPALNDLLAPYGVMLGDAVIHGTATLAGMRLVVGFGSDIAKVPEGGWLHKASFTHAIRRGNAATGNHGYLGGVAHGSAGGHVVVFSDSNCLDRSHMSHNCYELLERLLGRLLDGTQGLGVLDEANKLSKPYETPLYNFTPPARRPLFEYNFTEVSYVLSHPTPVCFPNAACEKMPNDPVCKKLLAEDNATRSRQAAAAAAQAVAFTPQDSVLKTATVSGVGAVGRDRRGSGGGSGTVLLVHSGGTAPHSTALLGLTGLELLLLVGLALLGLFLAVWVLHKGTGKGAASLGTSGSAASGVSLVNVTSAARRDRLSNVRLRASDV